MATTEERSDGRRGGVERPVKAAAANGIFAVRGEYWTLGYGGRTFPLKDIKGLSYIQRLLQHPGEEFHSLDLLSGGTGAMNLADSGHKSAPQPEGTDRIGGLGDSGEMLDAQAKEEYTHKLLELKEVLEDQRERGNHDRAEQVEAEIDSINRELARAVGLGGRDRRAGSASERARLNVTRAIKAALQKISEQQAAMGELLERSIRTGSFCSYVPDSRNRVTWQFSVESPEASREVAPAVAFIPARETSFLCAFTEGTTFVGREAERSLLSRCLEQALNGEGKMVLIGGAAGVGKTRIAAEIGAEASRRGMLTFVGSCYDRDDPVPFIPFVEILEEALARDPVGFRERLGNDAPEMARLLPRLLRVFPDISPPFDLPPDPRESDARNESRRILFRAIADLVVRAARNAPVLFLLDDLQWADEGTLLLLNHVAPLLADIPVLVVGTYRDVELDLGGQLSRTLDELIRRHQVERITLSGLSKSAVAQMLGALSGREPPDPVVSLIYFNTEGNPFFIEELFRHLVARGILIDSDGEFRRDLKLVDIDLPQSMRLVIRRQLARLNDETRKILGTAAVIGRSFTFELLEAATRVDSDRLLDCVEEAERAALIASSLEYPDARFRFSHELIRHAVLGDLSAARRQRLHLNVAESIERLHANALEDHADDLAHHLWNAGNCANGDKTVRFLAMAAKRALKQSAYEVALRHLQNALDLLKRLPDSEDRARRELDLQIDYGAALLATKGWYVPEAGNAYRRARELCRGLREDSRLFSVVCGLWSFHLVRGEHPKARFYADELVRLAPLMEDDGKAVQADWALGCSQFCMADFDGAHASFESAIGRYDSQKHRTLAFRFGQDPCMSSLCYDALTLWTLGYPEQADQRAQRALSLARELGHPFSLVWSLSNLAQYYSVRRDFSAAALHIEEGLRLATEHGFTFYEEILLAYKSVGLAAQGKLAELREASRRPRKTSEIGYEMAQTWFRSAFAEAFGNLGRIDPALTLLSEAAGLMERNEELYVEPEIHRIKGELLLRQLAKSAASDANIKRADTGGAEQCFRTAIETARNRGAKAYELRAALSLSQLLMRTGSRVEARRILKETYERFTEGFDTLELKTAAGLLTELTPVS